MLRLHGTVALFFWCFLLLHRGAVADEDALWGPTPSREAPPEKKSSSSWWTPSLPRLPSLPSLSFRIPFYGGSDSKDEASTTAPEGLAELHDHVQDPTGSGDSPPPTALTQALVTSTPKIRSESSVSPHGSTVQSDDDATNSFIRSTPSADAPITWFGTSGPARPPLSSTDEAGLTTEHLPEEHSVYPEAENSSQTLPPTSPPETTAPTKAPTTPTRAPTTTTTQTSGWMETTATSTHVLRTTAHLHPRTPPVDSSTTISPPLTSEASPTQTKTDSGPPETGMGDPGDQAGAMTSTVIRIDHTPVLGSITSWTESPRSTRPITGELPTEAGLEEEGGAPPAADEDADTTPAEASAPPTSSPRTTGSPSEAPPLLGHAADWTSGPPVSDLTLLPDCNSERSGRCGATYAWEVTTAVDVRPAPNATAANRSGDPRATPPPCMLVPLYTDWGSAMAVWGRAWEAHVYGAGCVFAVLALASALNLLCLPLRCPSGCGYFALVSLFLLAAGSTRSFSLLYDAYGHRDRIPSTEASLMLQEAPFPCLTAAFGLVFLLLSMRSRMQLSYSAFQRPCFLAFLVVSHFAAAFGPVTLLRFYQQRSPLGLLLSLVSRGAFVALATFLSAAYFVFYVYVRADSKHIYHLNNTSPTPAERYNRCPFAESRDWNRAAAAVCLSALFSLACAGLQLYAMLNAMGVAGGQEVFQPWPWWAFQFSCRLCELGVCLTLALVVAQPVYCSDQLPAAGSCWTELLASKSPITPSSYQWTLSQQEKLAIVDNAGLGETESLPLYTLMDQRLGSSLNGLDLLYHSNRALEADLGLRGPGDPEDGGGREPSGGSSFTSDSTADLRPPSPINLRRSIDEALFSEALFPMSLFSPTQPFRCSGMSVGDWTPPPSADSGLYRTSSCSEMASQPQPSPATRSSSSTSSPERWRGSSSSCSLFRASLGDSSLVLCPNPDGHVTQLLREGGAGHPGSRDPQRSYRALGAASQESLAPSAEADRSVQEEFLSVCRQIDAFSICSETIDL